jgi:hypothetical protein
LTKHAFYDSESFQKAGLGVLEHGAAADLLASELMDEEGLEVHEMQWTAKGGAEPKVDAQPMEVKSGREGYMAFEK